MDAQRRKQLKEEYRETCQPMGVLAFECMATGEKFLLASRHIPADITSVTFKLNSDYHPNRRLLELWRTYGEDGFNAYTVEELEYQDDVTDYQEDLIALRDMLIEQDPQARLLWK